MKKHVLMLLVAMMAVSTVMSQDFDFTAEAPSGQTLYYKLQGNSVSIVGPNVDNEWGDRSYSGYTKPTGDLVIPDSVTYLDVKFVVRELGKGAFYGCGGLTSIAIPSTIISIGWNALDGCSGLTSITIPSSVSSLGYSAFGHCYNLTTIAIPENIRFIPHSAFAYCYNLTSVTLSDSIWGIAPYAFWHCRDLTSITIPNNVDTIGFYAFSNCTSLTSITIPSGITLIDRNTFENCSSLDSVFIPSSVTDINRDAFTGCENISYLYYDGCSYTPVYIPQTSLQTVVVGNNITNIWYGAFDNNRTLTHVTLGSGVTGIESNAFRFCTALDTIVALPATAPMLGENAFLATHDKVVLTTCNANYATAWGTDGFVYASLDGFSLSLSSNNAAWGSAEFVQPVNCQQTAVVQAIATAGHNFIRWDDGNTDNPRTITLTQNATLTAIFGEQTVTVTALSDNVSMGSVSGSGTYGYGLAVILTATANTGYIFDHWSDNNTDNPRTLTVTQDTNLVAYFVSASAPTPTNYTVTLTANNNAWGTVTGSGEYTEGETATLTATANTGYRFVRWSDNVTDNPRQITVTGNVTLTAIFEAVQYTVTATANNSTMGSVTGGGTYNYGTTVDLTATANTGYRFVRWSDNNTNNPRQITVTGDVALSAVFTPLSGQTEEVNIRTCTGQTLRFLVDNGTLTATVVGYVGQCEGGLTVPAWFSIDDVRYTVTAIGPRAFQNCTGLTEVTLPVTITLVDEEAFKGCSGLLKVDMK